MTKQEEIREGIELYIRRTHFITPSHLDTTEATSLILSYLHSQGVVIKVDKELPKWEDHPWAAYQEDLFYKDGQDAMLKWHNDSFEPLVK